MDYHMDWHRTIDKPRASFIVTGVGHMQCIDIAYGLLYTSAAAPHAPQITPAYIYSQSRSEHSGNGPKRNHLGPGSGGIPLGIPNPY